MNETLSIYDNAALEEVAGFGQLLSASEESATYEAHFADAGHATVVEVRPADSQGAEQRLGRWKEAIGLPHPNLLRLHAAGHAVLNHVPVIYLVKERADESLSEVLSSRALSHEEAAEMLAPALSALDYLHKSGYTLGRLQAADILAVGETLKLSAEDAARQDAGRTPADDMLAFGGLMLEALRPGPEGVEAMPEPLRGVLKHCVDPDRGNRWSAAQALRWLSGEAVPAAVAEQPRLVSDRVRPDVERAPDHRKWIYGVAAALLLAAGLIWSARKPAAPVPASAGTQVATTSDAPAPAVAARPEKREVAQVAAPREAQAREAEAPRHDRRSGSWVVVIASYGSRSAAEKRTHETARRWPRFHVELVEAASEKARLLVVIGRNLSEKEAEALRNRARSSGLPRDTYIKRIDTGNG